MDRNGKQFTQIKDLENNNFIEYSRVNESVTFTENVKAVFTFTNNAENNFLKNIVTVDVKKEKNRGNLVLNNNPIFQRVMSPNYGFQNSLSTIIPFGKNKFFNVKSILDFTQDKQTYAVSPTQNLFLPNAQLYQNNSLYQHYRSANFYTQNSISISWAYGNWRITPQYEIELTNKKLNTNLIGDQEVTSMYINNLNYSFLKNNLNVQINYKKNKLNTTLTLPLILNNIQLNNQANFDNLTKNTIIFNPAFFANYELNSQIKFRGGVNFSKTYTPLSQLYANYIFSNLNFTAYNNDIQQANTYNVNMAGEYKNPFSNLFGNISASYNFLSNAILLGTTINENGQQIIEAITQKNKSHNKTAGITLGKYFTNLSTNLKGSFNLMQTENEVLVNNLLRNVTINKYSYLIEISNATFSWIGFVYKLNYAEQQRNQLATKTNTYNSSHSIKAELFLIKNQSISWGLEYQESIFNQQKFANRFMDLKYRYKWNKKRIDFDIDWTNILNTKQFEQVVINNIQTTTTTYNIRPSQILASIRFNF